MVRARWSVLLVGSPLLQAAFSLESVADEVIFVAEPVLVTLLATEVYPASGIAVAAAPAWSARYCSPHSTPPSPQPIRCQARAAGHASTCCPPRAWPRWHRSTSSSARCSPRSTWLPLDFAARHGHRPLAGLILGGYALGSAAGGLSYGSRAWRAPLRRQFALTLGAAAAGTATFCAMPGPAPLAAVMFISGLPLSPMLIIGFSLIEQQAPPGRVTEGMAWLTSAISVGTAAGSAAAGQVVDTSGARWGYVFAAACATGAALACLAGLTLLTVPSPHSSPAACADAPP
jgi:MFS transporter